MAKLEAGVTVEKFPIADEEIGGLKFSHVRGKNVSMIVWCVILLPCIFDMYVGSESRNYSPWVQFFWQSLAVISSVALIGGLIVLIDSSFRREYTALLPGGILHATAKIPLFITWDEIEEMSTHGSGKQRETSLRIKHSEGVKRNFNLRAMQAFSGWDWNFTVKDFKCRPEFIETALHYFYLHPEKRAELGTEQGLIILRKAVAERWQNPQISTPIPKP